MNNIIQEMRLAGIAVVPSDPETKVPTFGGYKMSDWSKYGTILPTIDEVNGWLERAKGWCIVTGASSGNIEVLDFDEKHEKGIFEKWKSMLDSEERAVLATLPLNRTKSNGYHVWYKSDFIERSKKLAITIGKDLKTGEDCKGEASIETRGQGGQAVIPPSTGYVSILGSMTNIPVITSDMRFRFFDKARKCSQWVEIEKIPETFKGKEENFIDAYNASSVTLEDLLIPHGWKKVGRSGTETYWARPGVNHASATENWGGRGLFHVFSSSAQGFESERSYSKFAVFAHLNHGGNYKEAYKAICPSKETRKAKEEKQEEESELQIVQMEDVQMEPIDWLWEGRIPYKKITLISGEPGKGKSQLTCLLASAVSSGKEFYQTKKADIGKVCIISAEDDEDDTIAPRLTAYGANMKNVFSIKGTIEKESKKVSPLDISKHIEKMHKSLPKDIKLIIVDPISAFLGDTDSNNNSAVRSVLMGLQWLAKERGCAIVVITHNNKSGSDKSATSKVMGSLAFIAAVRMGYSVQKSPDNPNENIFTCIKANIAKEPPTLVFDIQPYDFEIKDRTIHTSKINWLREDEFITSQTLNDKPQEDKGSKKVDSATDFLIEKIDGREQIEYAEVTRIIKEAEEEGFNYRTITRARVDIGYESKNPDGRGNIWIKKGSSEELPKTW
jgi:archaellum biogenesis ATPase FlaH